MKYAPSPELCQKYDLTRGALSREWMLKDMDAAERAAINLAPHTPEMVKRSQAIVLATVAEFETWAKKTYGVAEDWTVVVRFEWARTRNRSWGGIYSDRSRSYEMNHSLGEGARISLAMSKRVPSDHRKMVFDSNDDFSFHEYKSFCRDDEIGDFTGSWEDCLRVLTIHECAHALQYTPKAVDKEYDKKEVRGHGQLWKDLYRAARRNFGFTKAPPAEVIVPNFGEAAFRPELCKIAASS